MFIDTIPPCRFWIYASLLVIFFDQTIDTKTARKATHSDPAQANIVGYLKFANGLGRVTTTWIDILSPDIKIKFIDTRPHLSSFEDIPSPVQAIALSKKRATAKRVSVLTDGLWLPDVKPSATVPQSHIRLAYSMCESTKIPGPWTAILNKHFDAVIVPDEFLIKVYKNSGVKIPIFVLPLALYLDELLKTPLKSAARKPFLFGVSASLSRNKNVRLLIDAFAEEFGNRSDIVLKIHSPLNGNSDELRERTSQLKLTNVEWSIGALAWSAYIKFMQGIDCYVLLSKGEGFSITVREALALGLPCIISNNSAHQTICKTGLVHAVRSEIRKPSEREFYQVDVGDNFNCSIHDVRKALRHAFHDYDSSLKQAQKRRDWAKQFTFDHLRNFYCTVVNPKNIVLAHENKITNDTLITNSSLLYKKYQALRAPRKKLMYSK